MRFRYSPVAIALTVAALLAGCGSSSSSDKPAATVNGRTISMASYQAAFNQERVKAADQQGYDVCSYPSLAAACTDIKRAALADVIDRELVRAYADKQHITVTDADFNRRWAIVFRTRFDNRTDVLDAFAKRLHVSVSDIRQGVRDDILRTQVLYSVTRNMSNYAPGVKLAVIIASSKAELTATKAFLARHLSFQQITAALAQHNVRGPCGTGQCGERGWIPNALVNNPQIAEAPAGSVIGPIASQKFWEFFRVENHSNHLRLTADQQYTLRQALFARWLQRQSETARVKRYVAV